MKCDTANYMYCHQMRYCCELLRHLSFKRKSFVGGIFIPKPDNLSFQDKNLLENKS